MDRAEAVRTIVTGGRAKGLSDDRIRALVALYDSRQQEPPEEATKAPPVTIGPSTAGQRLSSSLANLEGLPGVIVGAGRRALDMMTPWNSSERADLNPYQRLGSGAASAGALALALPTAAARAPGIVAQGLKGADTAVKAATGFIEAHPSITAAAGGLSAAASGAGIEGILAGIAGGRYAPSLLKLLLSRGATAAAKTPDPAAAAKAAASAAKASDRAIKEGLKRLGILGRREYDDILAGERLGKMGTSAAAPVTEAAAVENPLVRELAKRIDWRSVDAVPIDAIARDVSRGGTILEAGESQIGLGEQLANLLKSPSTDKAAEVERIAKALRQRMHIRAGATRR